MSRSFGSFMFNVSLNTFYKPESLKFVVLTHINLMFIINIRDRATNSVSKCSLAIDVNDV